MSEVERLIHLIGDPIFIAIGGEDWSSDAHLGLWAVAILAPLLALIIAIIAIRSHGSE